MAPAEPERYVTPAAAHRYWAKHAYEILVETAGRYNAVITYADLAEEVQRRSGLWTKAQLRNWIGGLLRDLAKVSHLRGEPALTSLVVHKTDGQVGAGYDEVLRLSGVGPIDDDLERETHAAATRLECYRHWGADVPVDAQPTLSPRMRELRARAAGASPTRSASTPHTPRPSGSTRATGSPRASSEPRRGAVCPTCFMEMPLSGRCTNCED